MNGKVNRHGTPLGPQGYVLCGQCGEEVPHISKDTAPAYARCRNHGGWGGDAAERERKRQAFFEQKRQEKEEQL